MITLTNNESTPTLLKNRFVGSTPVKAIAKGDEYLYRDTKDLNFSFRLIDKIPNGFAKINRIQGNTVVWNQLIQNGDFSDGTNNWVGVGGATKTITVNNGECTIQKTGGSSTGALYKIDGFIADTLHKYYVCATLKTNSTGIDAAFGFYTYTGSTGGNTSNITQSETFIKIANIVSPASDTDMFALRSGKGSNDSASATFKNVMLIDLTPIYGTDNEPSTTEEFEADYFRWFGKPLTYEPYDAGSLRNVQMTGIKSVGFNLWDEEYIQGKVLTQSGVLSSSFTDGICVKNYIKCVPLTDYYIYNGTIDSGGRICFYDINKTFISTATNIANAIITTPDDAYYLKISFGHYGSTYNNDICINISDPSKNGTYEPYEGSNINFDITSPNIWDELWESGSIDVDGTDLADSNYIRTTNSIEVIYGILYYIKSPIGVELFYYDHNNTFISKSSSINNTTFEPPTNCKYVKFIVNETTYNNDICININDTNINGNYYPHKPFADGMKRIDDLFDEITSESVIKRIGSVDLGTLNWTVANSTYNVFLSSILPIATRGGLGSYHNPQIKMMVSSTYTIPSITKLSNELDDLGLTVNAGGAHTLVVRNTNYSTAEDFKAAVSGIIVNYELATPILFDRKTDLLYLATNGGTEEILFEDVSPILDITYNGLKDIYYGIEFDETGSSPDCTRVGSMILHKLLPIHNKMKGCLLNDDGEVVKYLNPNDWTSEIRDGSLGLVMVEIPMHYRKFETDGTKHRVLISEYPLPGYHLVKKQYVSAYQATVDRTNNKLASVVNTTALYRGGNNQSAWDELEKSLLGMPATAISRTNFRTYARNRKSDSTAWNCMTYDMLKTLYWMYVIEYATLNCLKAYNASLDANEYHQGGLGSGVTNLNSDKWNAFNGYYPFIPCGYTDSLGNSTGLVAFDMPSSYDSESTLTTYVPRYRGVENPFGHIWLWIDGINVRINPTTANGGNDLSEVFVCSDPAKFTDSNYEGYSMVGYEARSNGYVKKVIFGEYGEIMPLEGGATDTTYFCDYHYTNIPTSKALRGVFFGGSANYGAYAGFLSARSHYGPGSSHAYFGSRLCYIQ